MYGCIGYDDKSLNTFLLLVIDYFAWNNVFRLRHLVPEKDRLDGLEPLMMQDDEQNIYRCISKGLFKSDALWAVLKLETLKYAISSESDMLSKVYGNLSFSY